jgi:sialate O-acetylesterase
MKIHHLSFFAVVCGFVATAHAELKLPAIIGDNMVLQQKQANPIWGWDTPGTEVVVTFAGQTKTGKAGDDGKWTVTLDALSANATPSTMTFKGTDSKVVKNILIGEVWLCSGQSNMQWPVQQTWDGDLEILTANDPEIRLVKVPNVGTQEAQKDFKGQWRVCNPSTVGGFSAVGYYYGRLLHQTLGVPVGLIDNSWGGSAAEAWVKRDVFDADARFKAEQDQWEKTEATYDFQKVKADFEIQKAAWDAKTPEEKAAGQAPRSPSNPLIGNQRPGNLYAGCLHPIIGYGIKGVIWYQGESNTGRAAKYNDLMTLLIGGWRSDWKQGNFPFYFVQLADFMAEKSEPGNSAWAELREAQTLTMNTVENTGQAVIIDLGETNNIHPRNKRDVAERLARWALVKDYGFDQIPHRSPEFKNMEIKDNKAVIIFDHVGDGLRTLDVDELKGFSICGEDGKWVWADAKFVAAQKNDTVEVSSPHVAKPVAVRYAWADNPVCNILSTEGLPLTPFRTDRSSE